MDTKKTWLNGVLDEVNESVKDWPIWKFRPETRDAINNANNSFNEELSSILAIASIEEISAERIKDEFMRRRSRMALSDSYIEDRLGINNDVLQKLIDKPWSLINAIRIADLFNINIEMYIQDTSMPY